MTSAITASPGTTAPRGGALVPEREAEVRRLLARLAAGWRSILTPRTVREVEDEGLRRAVDALPPPDRGPDPWAGLAEIDRRNRDLERRMREMARLYDRRREEP
jgi:hypothetical protein